MLSRVLPLAAGALLVLGGLAILLSGGVSLPTRSPATYFNFAGGSLFLLGATPLLAGGTCIAIAARTLSRQSHVTRLLIGICIVMLGLGFFLAPKGPGRFAHMPVSFSEANA